MLGPVIGAVIGTAKDSCGCAKRASGYGSDIAGGCSRMSTDPLRDPLRNATKSGYQSGVYTFRQNTRPVGEKALGSTGASVDFTLGPATRSYEKDGSSAQGGQSETTGQSSENGGSSDQGSKLVSDTAARSSDPIANSAAQTTDQSTQPSSQFTERGSDKAANSAAQKADQLTQPSSQFTERGSDKVANSAAQKTDQSTQPSSQFTTQPSSQFTTQPSSQFTERGSNKVAKSVAQAGEATADSRQPGGSSAPGGASESVEESRVQTQRSRFGTQKSGLAQEPFGCSLAGPFSSKHTLTPKEKADLNYLKKFNENTEIDAKNKDAAQRKIYEALKNMLSPILTEMERDQSYQPTSSNFPDFFDYINQMKNEMKQHEKTDSWPLPSKTYIITPLPMNGNMMSKFLWNAIINFTTEVQDKDGFTTVKRFIPEKDRLVTFINKHSTPNRRESPAIGKESA